MAVVKRGKKGVFYMLFMLEGKRVYRSTGKYTKKEALLVESAEKHKMIKEANLPPHEKNARTLLQDVADQIYETRWKHGKDSQRSYMRACNLIKIIGNIPIGEVNQDKVEDLVRARDKANAASGTINRYLTSLKMMLKYKKQDTDYIKLRKERKGRIRVISPEEEQQVVNLLRHTIHGKRRSFYPEVADLVEVLVDSGLRLSELLDLRYDDINFDTNLMSIWINKGDRPRSIPMTKRVRRIMEARKKEGVEKPFTLKPYQAENAWRWVKREMKLEKDKEFLIHALRHTTATRLVNRGIDLYVVKEWLGHSTIQVTEKYSHLAPHKLEEALSVLE